MNPIKPILVTLNFIFSNFTYVRNNMYGNCYTFNAFDNGQDPLAMNYPGPLMGACLCMSIYHSLFNSSAGPLKGVCLYSNNRKRISSAWILKGVCFLIEYVPQ